MSGERHERGKAFKLRLLADGNKKAVHAKRRLFAGNGIAQPQRAERAVPGEKSGDLHGREDLDVLPREEPRLFFGVAAEGIAPVNEIHGFTDIGEQQRLLQRAVPAADNGGDAVFIESAVAHRAVGNAAAEQLLLARQTEMAVLRARGEDHGAAFVCAVLRANGEILSGALHGDHFADVGFGVEREHLLEHPLGELRPADGGDAGVVFHARRIGDLAAVALAFEKKNGFPASAGINGGGHSRRAAPGNDDVVHVSLTFRGENPSVAALCAATAPLLGEPS